MTHQKIKLSRKTRTLSLVGAVMFGVLAPTSVLGSVVAASPVAQAKCSPITTPIKEISGFRKTSQKCVRNTFTGNKFVFVAKKAIPGTDLANGNLSQVAKLFQGLNKSLAKSWTWGSEGFGKGIVVTPETLKNTHPDCIDVFTECVLGAGWSSDAKQRVSTMTVTVEWIEGDCISPPNCGGWYSSKYRLKLTITASEQFWE